ncbi:WSC domain-containing protein 2 isoform X2 [Salvelinus fontinalis]|uniref:WSC domain-containing protein 2 isoform X2 n=1 Tax=Salvelinus fontinalis TaxID=8038 RepID=UPI002485F4F8|nr:WSC domain-containing protein 2 isoform X2 [Salvelinus fontinalis]
MARPLLKIQRYFRRKPVRFFSFILLYLTAGSLVFLHSGFVGDNSTGANGGRDPLVASEMGNRVASSDGRRVGMMGRVFKENRRPTPRRYGPPWMKGAAGKDSHDWRARGGDYTSSWNRALKGRNAKDLDDGRANYIGCYIDNTAKRALRGVSFFDYKKMTVFRCQDNCAERGYLYSGLEFGAECYCGHKIQAPNASESECNMECKGEKGNLCGGANRLSIYRLELSQESARRYNRCMDRHFLPTRSKQLMALASFPGAGNTWARHLIELATGFYTGSYYFDGSLYNKGFKGERDHWRSGRNVCIKTHESGKKEIEAFDASIVMIRNPYKALMAEFNRKYGGHIGFASQAHWRGKEWPEFVKNYAPWWASHTLDWLRYGRNVHVVHFEELKRELFSKLKDMVLFLGLEVAEDRLLCVEGQKDGNFKRSGLRKLEYDPYTPEMRASIDELVMTVDAALKKRNMAGVPKEYRPTSR